MNWGPHVCEQSTLLLDQSAYSDDFVLEKGNVLFDTINYFWSSAEKLRISLKNELSFKMLVNLTTNCSLLAIFYVKPNVRDLAKVCSTVLQKLWQPQKKLSVEANFISMSCLYVNPLTCLTLNEQPKKLVVGHKKLIAWITFGKL